MHLIIGNDLSGDMVVVNPVIIEKHEVTASIDQIEDEIHDLCPSCAVTRALARKATIENAQVGKSTNSDYKYEINDQACIMRVINKHPEFVFLKNRTLAKVLL